MNGFIELTSKVSHYDADNEKIAIRAGIIRVVTQLADGNAFLWVEGNTYEVEETYEEVKKLIDEAEKSK